MHILYWKEIRNKIFPKPLIGCVLLTGTNSACVKFLRSGYKISKDINKYSPGSILLYFFIKYFFDKKINFFDFGTGDEIYKKKWSNSVYNNYELIYGFTLKGKIYKMIKIFYR